MANLGKGINSHLQRYYTSSHDLRKISMMKTTCKKEENKCKWLYTFNYVKRYKNIWKEIDQKLMLVALGWWECKRHFPSCLPVFSKFLQWNTQFTIRKNNTHCYFWCCFNLTFTPKERVFLWLLLSLQQEEKHHKWLGCPE